MRTKGRGGEEGPRRSAKIDGKTIQPLTSQGGEHLRCEVGCDGFPRSCTYADRRSAVEEPQSAEKRAQRSVGHGKGGGIAEEEDVLRGQEMPRIQSHIIRHTIALSASKTHKRRTYVSVDFNLPHSVPRAHVHLRGWERRRRRRRKGREGRGTGGERVKRGLIFTGGSLR